MKFNRIMLIFIILLAIFMIGSVSASQNTTVQKISDSELNTGNVDLDVTGDENDDVDDDSDDDFDDDEDDNSTDDDEDYNETDDENETELIDDYEYNVDVPDTVFKEDDEITIDVTLPDDATGKIIVSIDGFQKYNQEIDSSQIQIRFYELVSDLTYGNHNVNVTYTGDTQYLGFDQVYTVNITYYKITVPNPVIVDDDDFIYIYLPSDATGDVTFKVDGTEIETTEVDYGQVTFYVGDLSYKTHTYEIRYTNGNYNTFTKKGSFKIEYKFDVEISETNPEYGETVSVTVTLPPDAIKNIAYTINGGSSITETVDDGMASFELNTLKLGTNTLVIKYLGDETYAATSKTFTINVTAKMDIPTKVRYNSDDGIYIRLPSDAKGTIQVTIDNETYKNEKHENGIFSIKFSNLTIGEYDIEVKYTGTDYIIKTYNGTLEVIPYIKYPISTWINDNVEISIELPKNATGNFTISKDGIILANTTVIQGKAALKFNLDIGEEQDINVYYSGDGFYESFEDTLLINIREFSNQTNMTVIIPENIIYDDARSITIQFSPYASGYVNVTLNNVYYGEFEVSDGEASIELADLVSNLEQKTHTIKFDYSGDDYYIKRSTTESFKLSYIRYIIPETIILGKNETAIVYLPDSADGTVTLTFSSTKLTGVKNDEEEYYEIDLSDLSVGQYTAILKYTGDSKYKDFSEEILLNVTYDMEINAEEFPYGETATVEISFPPKATGEVELSINGKTYTEQISDGKVSFNLDN